MGQHRNQQVDLAVRSRAGIARSWVKHRRVGQAPAGARKA
jgi:hypothetical protein